MKVASTLLALALCSAPVAAHQGGHDTRGVVTSVSARELIIKTSHGEERFVLTAGTEFVKDGSPGTAQDLKASDRVVVHAKQSGEHMEAVKVQFKSAASPKKR
jgi:hypothetical protein